MKINVEKIKKHIIAGVASLNNERCLVQETTCIGTAKRGSIQIHITVTRDRDEFMPSDSVKEHRSITGI